MLAYSSLRPEDAKHLTALYEEFLNGGESIGPWLLAGLEDPDYCGAKCVDQGRMVGAFSARPGVEFTCGQTRLAEQIQSRYHGQRLFTADMLTTLEDYRGHGIARRLALTLRRQLVAKGCQKLVIEAWHRSAKDDMPVMGVVKYLSKCVETFGSYDDFYADIGAYGLTCPECGGSLCHCGADILVLDIV